MQEYHKIQSVFKRDEKTHNFILGEYSLPEFEYLQDNLWVWTEKIDGTNVRVGWDGVNLEFGGRTANAQMPIVLLKRLQEIFTSEKLATVFPDIEGQIVLYGEGYGARIQKGGGNYIPDGVDFILFDVKVGGWWLKREGIEEIAESLGVKAVPIIFAVTIHSALKYMTNGVGIKSEFGNFQAEGLVGKPAVDLFTRSGKRIVTKMKHKDFLSCQEGK